MYSLYLLASTKAGLNNTLANTDFNVLLRWVWFRVGVAFNFVKVLVGVVYGWKEALIV